MSVQGFLSALALYLELGLAVALVFVLQVGRIDHAARGAYWFRPLLVPGATLLWPLVAVRMIRAFTGAKS